MGKKERIVEDLKFAKDVMLGLPIATVVGNCEVYVENFKSIVHYESDCVRMLTKSGYISIEGAGLKIDHYNEEEIAVRGRVCKIEYF